MNIINEWVTCVGALAALFRLTGPLSLINHCFKLIWNKSPVSYQHWFIVQVCRGRGRVPLRWVCLAYRTSINQSGSSATPSKHNLPSSHFVEGATLTPRSPSPLASIRELYERPFYWRLHQSASSPSGRLSVWWRTGPPDAGKSVDVSTQTEKLKCSVVRKRKWYSEASCALRSLAFWRSSDRFT